MCTRVCVFLLSTPSILNCWRRGLEDLCRCEASAMSVALLFPLHIATGAFLIRHRLMMRARLGQDLHVCTGYWPFLTEGFSEDFLQYTVFTGRRRCRSHK